MIAINTAIDISFKATVDSNDMCITFEGLSSLLPFHTGMSREPCNLGVCSLQVFETYLNVTM